MKPVEHLRNRLSFQSVYTAAIRFVTWISCEYHGAAFPRRGETISRAFREPHVTFPAGAVYIRYSIRWSGAKTGGIPPEEAVMKKMKWLFVVLLVAGISTEAANAADRTMARSRLRDASCATVLTPQSTQTRICLATSTTAATRQRIVARDGSCLTR